MRGHVVAAESGAPLPDVLVLARRSHENAVTDRFGRFRLAIGTLPDTLTFAFIGRASHVAEITSPEAVLRVELSRAAIPLPEVVVSGSARSIDQLGRWALPAEALRLVPAAVEPDVLRALSLIPSVSFTTPLSARPLVRGYDADLSSFRLDGFEVLNPFHLGRFFGAIPSEATQQVSVSTGPVAPSVGGALAGVVDVTGRVGPADGRTGGGGLSLVSLSPWAAGGTSTTWFAAGRLVHLGLLDELAGGIVPYDFQDLYLGASVTDRGGERARATAFASRDHLFDRDAGSGMDWSNLLLGARLRALEVSGATVTLSGVVTRFAEDVTNLEVRGSRIDARSRFTRAGTGVEITSAGRGGRLLVGGGIHGRWVDNDVRTRSGEPLPEATTRFTGLEADVHAEWTWPLGPLTVQPGLRLDVLGGESVLQPRLRMSLPVGAGAALGAGIGRGGRLYHLISDPRAEPDVAFHDFWLRAGDPGVPAPTVDHATVDVSLERAGWAGRLSVFGSRGRNLGELRPETDQDPGSLGDFRFGDSRTLGIEAFIGRRLDAEGRGSVSLSYVLSTSQRRWQGEWVRWSQDRRHTARLSGTLPLGASWSLFGFLDAASGLPLTPVSQVVIAGIPDSTGFGRTPKYIYGAENSARSSGTLRLDVGGTYAFQGPWHSRMWLGLSVINLAFGPVAPMVASPPTIATTRVTYERLFDLPAVPSASLRIEF